MKKIIASLLAISSLVACTKECEQCESKDCPDSTLTCKTDLAKGLIAYYPFNGNFNDESGNGNNATAKNGAFLTTDFLGRSNKAAGFDGADDYLIVPGSNKLNADTITVSFQVMVNTMNRRHVTVSRINFETGQSLAYGIHHSLPTDNKWNFGVTPGTDDCSKLYPYDTSLAVYSKGPIQAGRWYNIIASFVGGVQKIYVDGVLQSTTTRTFTKAKKCNNADLMIGGWWKNDLVSIDGKIDEVRLYNRALSDCEISKLAETFKTDSTCKTDLSKGMLAYYPFNGNFNDESGNGNTAVAKNGAFLTSDYLGKSNSCAGFDGSNDYLIVPGSSKLNSDTFSVSLQVMVNSINRRHAVFNRVNFENATAFMTGIGVKDNTINKFSTGVVSNAEDCSIVNNDSQLYPIYPGTTIQPGKWYNLLISFAGGVQKYYINGVLQQSITRSFTKTKQCANADLVIGGWWKNDIMSIDGKIDDVRIYNRVLTDCEISKLAEDF
jgi:hypothetical protein